MLKLDLKDISTYKLFWFPRTYAGMFACDDLLDALNLCKQNDILRKEALYNILSVQLNMHKNAKKLELSLNGILDRFFSKPDPHLIIKNFVIGDSDEVEDEDSDVTFEKFISENGDGHEINDENIELRFKKILLEFCTLVVKNEPLSDKIMSFAYELNIDLSNTYFLNKLKNDLMFDLRCIYDTDNDCFEALSDEDVDALGLLKDEYDLVIQFRIDNPDRYSGKNIKFGCSAMGDKLNNSFFGDDVVEYEAGDDFVPLDYLCYKDDSNLSENDRWVEFDFDEENEKFFVCTPTYRKNTADPGDEPNYCRFVDIRSYDTGKVYTVLSW